MPSRPADIRRRRRAVENGKRLEALMAKAGVDLVKSLRESAG